MDNRPVVVRGSSSGPAMIGIIAIVVIFAIALFVWQPWNTTTNKTTIINQQPAGSSAQGGNAAGAGSGTSGGSSSGSSSSGSSSGSNGQ